MNIKNTLCFPKIVYILSAIGIIFNMLFTILLVENVLYMNVEHYFRVGVFEKYNDRVFTISHFNIKFQFKICSSCTINKQNAFLYFSNAFF